MKIKANVNAYSEVPEGTATIHQAWSGDPIAGQYYLPKGETTDVLAYWRPEDPAERVIGSDNIAIPKSATKPVLRTPDDQRPSRQRDRACATSGGTATSRR